MTLPTEALDFIEGRRRLFAVHQSYANTGYQTLLRRVGGEVPSAALGSVVSLSTSTPANAAARVALGTRAHIRLADPQLWKHDTSGWPAVKPGEPKKALNYSWWSSAKPHSQPVDAAWVAEVLQTQRDAGANLLLSATGWVEPSNARKSLDDATRWVQASRDAVLGEPMFVNLAFDLSWLSNPSQLSMLLTELVESTEELWYLRFFWPKNTVRYGQLTRADVLDGYAQLVAVAGAEDKRLVLANTGLTGWIATALGGAGFSTGNSWPEQAFVDSPGGGGGKGARKERYFDRNVLHTVEHPAQIRLARQAGYVTCTCAYCAALFGGGPWSHAYAGDHGVMRAAALTESILSAPNPRASAHATVASAIAFNARLTGTAALSGNDRPRHLPLWESTLR